MLMFSRTSFTCFGKLVSISSVEMIAAYSVFSDDDHDKTIKSSFKEKYYDTVNVTRSYIRTIDNGIPVPNLHLNISDNFAYIYYHL